jgi:hypothetical protein
MSYVTYPVRVRVNKCCDFRKKTKFETATPPALSTPEAPPGFHSQEESEVDHSSLPVIGLKGSPDRFVDEFAGNDFEVDPAVVGTVEPPVIFVTTPVSIFVTNPRRKEPETTPRQTTPRQTSSPPPRQTTPQLPRRPSPTTQTTALPTRPPTALTETEPLAETTTPSFTNIFQVQVFTEMIILYVLTYIVYCTLHIYILPGRPN